MWIYMSAKKEAYLNKIDALIERGSYKDNWQSLSEYPEENGIKMPSSGFLFIGTRPKWDLSEMS